MSSVVGYLNCYSCSLSSGTSLLSLLIFSSPNTFKFPRQKCSFVRLDISRSIHHAMRFAKYFSERACVLFFLPACKYYLVLANQKRTGISTMALSLSVGRRAVCLHRCYDRIHGSRDSSLRTTTIETELARATFLLLVKWTLI